MQNHDSLTRRNSRLNEIAEQFELDWKPDIRIYDYLSEPDETARTAIAVELIRLDMEYRWRTGEPVEVERYLNELADCQFTKTQLGDIAFEEYRLRFQFDSPLSPAAFSNRLGVDVTRWPVWNDNQTDRPSVEGRRQKRPELPSPGEIFHGYELVGVLGEGAFGRVFLARQADLANRFVAVKVTEISDTEPQALARLQHTNIVPVYSLKRENGLQSICMPFLGLVTLQDLVARVADPANFDKSGQELITTIAAQKAETVNGTTKNSDSKSSAVPETDIRNYRAGSENTPEREAEVTRILGDARRHGMPVIAGLNYLQTMIWMYERVAEGLAYAHSRNIVHGDLKPGNVLVSDDGQPLILDFHLSSNSESINRSGYAGGTFPYMSPRHLQTLIGESTLDASCDIFAIGVMMFESLTGRLPYPGGNYGDDSVRLMIQQRQQPPPGVRTINRSIPVDIETIVGRCLSSEPGAKYESIEEVRTDLDRQLSNLPLRFAPNRSIRERTSKWVRRHPRITSASAMALFALAIVMIAGISIASWLSTAAAIRAASESRQFVSELDRLVAPLTIPGLDQEKRDRYWEEVSARLDRRSGNGKFTVLDHKKLLDRLPAGIRNEENRAVVNAQYWLAATIVASQDNQADKQSRSSELNEALERIEMVRQISNPLPRAFVRLEAQVREIAGDRKGAMELLKSGELSDIGTEDSFPNSSFSAEEFQQMGDNRSEIDARSQVLARNPGNYAAWLSKGNAHFAIGELDRAIECFSMCVALEENSWPGWFQRGYSYLRKNDFAQALVDFSKCIELEPDDPDFHLHRAQALKGTGRLQEAIDELSVAIELGTPQTRAWYVRYQLNRQLARNDAASKDLETFLAMKPIDANGWISRGMAQVSIKNNAQALSDFISALQLDPDRSEPESLTALQNIAALQSEYLGNLPEAIEAQNELVRCAPQDVVALVSRGVLLARNGERQKAHADAIAALKLRTDADILFRAAGIYALTSEGKQNEDSTRAIAMLRQAASIDPQLVLSRASGDHDLDRIRSLNGFRELTSQLENLVYGNIRNQ